MKILNKITLITLLVCTANDLYSQENYKVTSSGLNKMKYNMLGATFYYPANLYIWEWNEWTETHVSFGLGITFTQEFQMKEKLRLGYSIDLRAFGTLGEYETIGTSPRFVITYGKEKHFFVSRIGAYIELWGGLGDNNFIFVDGSFYAYPDISVGYRFESDKSNFYGAIRTGTMSYLTIEIGGRIGWKKHQKTVKQ